MIYIAACLVFYLLLGAVIGVVGLRRAPVWHEL
jgi:hypothetical protein